MTTLSKAVTITLATSALMLVPAIAFAQMGPGMGGGMGRGMGGMRGQGPGTGPVVQNCQPEIEKLCAGMEHGGGQIRDCLEKNRDKVSAACKQAMDSTGFGRRRQ